MSDHEAHQKRQRSDRSAVNPHPGNDTPKPDFAKPRGLVFTRDDVTQIEAEWRSIMARIDEFWSLVPTHWRPAVITMIRRLEAARECAACPFECREPGNPECWRLREKLPTLLKVENHDDGTV